MGVTYSDVVSPFGLVDRVGWGYRPRRSLYRRREVGMKRALVAVALWSSLPLLACRNDDAYLGGRARGVSLHATAGRAGSAGNAGDWSSILTPRSATHPRSFTRSAARSTRIRSAQLTVHFGRAR